MKFNNIKNMALVLSTLAILSGCGSDSDDVASSKGATIPDIESAKKVLTFYGTASNDNYAVDLETNTLTNLNENNKTAILEGEEGRLFVWIDNKGDDNASNDEDKVIMFKKNYSITDHNATWEDFHYINHLSGDEMHPHHNSEFNTTDPESAKYKAMVRLNEYLLEQEALKTELANSVTAKGTSICNYYSVKHENDTDYFVMGTDGYIYTYENNGTDTSFKDATLISSAGCVADESGISAAQEGVIVYLKSTSKLYLVDSHGDGVSHVHSEWNLSEILSAGASIDMMVGIVDLEHDGDEHDHEGEEY